MDDAEELALVERAVLEGLGGCIEWDGKSAERVRQNPELRGLTPEGIKSELIRCLRSGEATIKQKPEKREPYCRDFRFYYMAVLPIKGFKRGLFVEMRLVDADDPEYPIVLIVNAHLHTSL
jgi:hypothetical protein